MVNTRVIFPLLASLVIATSNYTVEPGENVKRELGEKIRGKAKQLFNTDVMLEEIELGSDDLGGISSDHGKVLRAIMENPDLKVRPNANGAPVTVFCNIYVCSFDSISETSMDYSVTMYVRHLWNDSRLEFNSSTPITVSGSQTDGMWIPDLFFTNSKDAAVHISTSTRQSVLLRITPRGEVLYTIRMSVKLSCHMNLENFPMDRQECYINVESFSYTTDDILLKWTEGIAVKLDNTVTLPQYSVDGVHWEEKLGEYLTGNYGQVEVKFRLVRRIGFYVLQAYIPSLLLVVLSWLALWMEITSAPARVSLGITTVLALVTQGTWMRNQLPKIAYVTAIDVWLVSCQVFVFATLIEFALVYYMHSWEQGQYQLQRMKRASRKAVKSGMTVKDNPWSNGYFHGSRMQGPSQRRQSSVEETGFRLNPSKRKDFMDRAIMIDHVCRVFFPASFITFNIVYWYKYLIQPYQN